MGNLHSIVKSITLAGVVAFCSGSALADGYSRGSLKDAPYAAPFTWTGVYVGAHLGGAWGGADWTNTSSNAAAGAWPDLIPGDKTSHDFSGVIGGGHIGINQQAGQFVYGAEASFSGMRLDGSSISGPGPFSAQDDHFNTRVQSLLLLTGRVGYAWDRWMLYGKGGYAGADVKAQAVDNTGVSQGAGKDTHWASGWTIGTGIEYALTNSMIIGLQYDLIHLGSHSANVGDATGVYKWDVDLNNIHTVTGRISFKLN